METVLGRLLRLSAWRMEVQPVFGWFHLVYLALGFGAAVFAAYRLRGVSDAGNRRLFWAIGCFLLASEAYKQLFFRFGVGYGDWFGQEGYPYILFPFHICSMAMYLCPAVAWLLGREAGQGKAGGGKAGQGKAGQGKAGQGEAGQSKAGQGKAGGGKAGQGKAGQGKAGQDESGRGEAGQGRWGSAATVGEALRDGAAKPRMGMVQAIYAFLAGFSMVGGLMSVVFDDGLMYPYITMTVHSMNWHFILVFIGVYLGFSGRVRRTAGNFARGAALFAALAVVAWCINVALYGVSGGTCDMFFIGPAPMNVVVYRDIAVYTGRAAVSVIFLVTLLVASWGVFFLPKFLLLRRLSLAQR